MFWIQFLKARKPRFIILGIKIRTWKLKGVILKGPFLVDFRIEGPNFAPVNFTIGEKLTPLIPKIRKIQYFEKFQSDFGEKISRIFDQFDISLLISFSNFSEQFFKICVGEKFQIFGVSFWRFKDLLNCSFSKLCWK